VAQLVVDIPDLLIQLSNGEKVGGLHASFRVPLSSIQSVSVPANPWLALRGWRMAGTGFPGRIALGTWRHGGGFDFCAVRKQQPAVQIDVGSGRFSRFLISVPEGVDPRTTADAIADAAGIARS
jgi:hypothetical protein